MSRDTPNQHPRSHLFTMRVWQEEVGHDRTEWGGKVHLITNGNVCYFRSYSRADSAPCCLGWCADGTMEQTAPGKPPVRVRVRVRLSALGSCSFLHSTTETNKVVRAKRKSKREEVLDPPACYDDQAIIHGGTSLREFRQIWPGLACRADLRPSVKIWFKRLLA